TAWWWPWCCCSPTRSSERRPATMDIDWTVLAFEVVNFGVLVVLLRRFLYRPVQRAIAARREEIEKVQHELKAREETAASTIEDYESRLRALEQQARERLESALTEG